eukprot:500346_1
MSDHGTKTNTNDTSQSSKHYRKQHPPRTTNKSNENINNQQNQQLFQLDHHKSFKKISGHKPSSRRSSSSGRGVGQIQHKRNIKNNTTRVTRHVYGSNIINNDGNNNNNNNLYTNKQINQTKTGHFTVASHQEVYETLHGSIHGTGNTQNNIDLDLSIDNQDNQQSNNNNNNENTNDLNNLKITNRGSDTTSEKTLHPINNNINQLQQNTP